MKRCCDLHTHSTYSDGTYTPRQLIEAALEIGLEAVVLSDHNNVSGLPEFLAAAEGRPAEAVGGVELSTDYGSTELHILGLYIDENYFDDINAKLFALVQEAQALSDSTRFSGYLPLILRGDQLSENCFWQAGYEIQNMVDGDFTTFFHSRTDIPLAEGTEYFQVNLDAPVNGFYIEYTGRSDGIASGWAWHDTPDEIRIEATNTPDDESSWKQISIEKYDIPNYHGAYYKSEVPIKLGAPYQYIRFYVLHATTGQNYWNIAEFQMYDAATTLSPEMLQALDIMDAAALEKLALVKAGAGTQTDIDELQALIDLIKNQTGIEQIVVDSPTKNMSIYTLDGRLVKLNVSADAVKSLSKGLYIINGRKVLIK